MPDEIPQAPLLIEIAIEPKSKADREKFRAALAELAAEDPLFGVTTDPESGQTILKGVSESQLEAKVERLKRDGISANIGAPQVAFRETITRRVEHSYTHKKQDRGRSQFASVTLVIEPVGLGEGYEFESTIVGRALPERFFPGVTNGLESVLSSGVVAGFPVSGVKARLIDAKYHDIDSSMLAFEIAARACFREALQKAGPVLLEPIMKVEVITPADLVGTVLGDLNVKRGQIPNLDEPGDTAAIRALVPLMNLFGYESALRETSQGRASFTMQFDHYAPFPPRNDPPFRPAIGMRA
jgi:elongation factor G